VGYFADESSVFPGSALRFESSVHLSVATPRTDTPAPHVTAEAWLRIFKHKSHNWVMGTENRDAGWSIFVDSGEKACFG
jgi:hypothetical protein